MNLYVNHVSALLQLIGVNRLAVKTLLAASRKHWRGTNRVSVWKRKIEVNNTTFLYFLAVLLTILDFLYQKLQTLRFVGSGCIKDLDRQKESNCYSSRVNKLWKQRHSSQFTARSACWCPPGNADDVYRLQLEMKENEQGEFLLLFHLRVDRPV